MCMSCDEEKIYYVTLVCKFFKLLNNQLRICHIIKALE